MNGTSDAGRPNERFEGAKGALLRVLRAKQSSRAVISEDESVELPGELKGVEAGLNRQALYTALTDLVGSFGEDHVCTLVDGLRTRILGGEFTMGGRRQ